MATQHGHDINQLLLDIAISTARLRAMADEAHTLVERLERRPTLISTARWPAVGKDGDDHAG